MKKYLLFLFAFSVFASCNTSNNPEKQTKNKTNQVVYPSDNPAERLVYENRRFKDPTTGRVPNDMRRKEMMFAKTLPVSTKLTKANWIHRGPYNVGGRTRAIAFDVQDENIILAGGTSGGMFRSTDGGQSWTMTTDPGQLHNVTCVAQDTRVGKEDTWYFGSGENRGGWLGDVSFLGNGIYKSTDGGLSWDSLSITTSNTPQSWDNDFDFVWNIVTDPSNDSMDVVYAAVHGDIYKSSDGGISWDKKLGGNNSSYYQYTSVEITSNGVVYAAISSNCVNKGIWRSPDGETWTKIIDGNFPAVYDRIALDVNPNNEDEVYCIAANTTGSGQFTNVFFGGTTWTSLWKYNYLSGDGSGPGALWTDLSANIPANQATTFDNFNAQGGYDLVIGVGVFMTEAIKDAAVQFPGTKFLLIDVPVEGFPNISSAIFASQEISFLAGALSALVDRDQSIQLPIRHNGILSIVGGLKIHSVDIYMAGFFQGARYINPDIEVLYGYTGVLGNPVVGKQLALSQHSKGSDIIYQLAGDTGLGVIEASKEANFLSVSSNSDQDSLVLDHVLTSTNKLFNVAVFSTIEETLRDNFPAGLVLYNLENGGLDISRLNKKVPQYISYRLGQIKEDIIDGNIRVGMEIPVWAKHQNQ